MLQECFRRLKVKSDESEGEFGGIRLKEGWPIILVHMEIVGAKGVDDIDLKTEEFGVVISHIKPHAVERFLSQVPELFIPRISTHEQCIRGVLGLEIVGISEAETRVEKTVSRRLYEFCGPGTEKSFLAAISGHDMIIQAESLF